MRCSLCSPLTASGLRSGPCRAAATRAANLRSSSARTSLRGQRVNPWLSSSPPPQCPGPPVPRLLEETLGRRREHAGRSTTRPFPPRYAAKAAPQQRAVRQGRLRGNAAAAARRFRPGLVVVKLGRVLLAGRREEGEMAKILPHGLFRDAAIVLHLRSPR